MSPIILSAFKYGITSNSTDLPKEITIEAGEASGQVLAALICAIFMGFSVSVGLFLDRMSVLDE